MGLPRNFLRNQKNGLRTRTAFAKRRPDAPEQDTVCADDKTKGSYNILWWAYMQARTLRHCLTPRRCPR
eukprot:5745299-Pyramimonas_sp.AAC.1